MRLLHTSDWHLGHTLHELSREREHARFLAWLLDVLDERAVDALLLAGDLFDSANPPATALAAFYGFLAEARRRRPRMTVVAIAGNHDSPSRLDAPQPLLKGLGMHLIGTLPRRPDRSLDLDRLVIPLRDASGEVAAWVGAVPFLRPADLPVLGEIPAHLDPLVEGVRRIYAEVFDEARRRSGGETARIAIGHCYMVDGEVSELSERKVLGGNQHALPVSLFPEDATYVALGHLHKPQEVGGRRDVRYSGSPIPLSLDEAAYRHHVCLVETRGPRIAALDDLAVPPGIAVPIHRLPAKGFLTLPELVGELKRLPNRAASDREEDRPLLEVRVARRGPEPTLRPQLEEALQGKAPRLVKVTLEAAGPGPDLAAASGGRRLEELTPEEVFRSAWRHHHEGEPDAPLLAAFHELLDAATQEGGT